MKAYYVRYYHDKEQLWRINMFIWFVHTLRTLIYGNKSKDKTVHRRANLHANCALLLIN